MDQLNVFGEVLPICCEEPMTGFTRSGSCETMDQDHGMHTVCAHMTDEFLAFSKANCAPKIYLTKTHEKTLELVPLKILREYALDIN